MMHLNRSLLFLGHDFFSVFLFFLKKEMEWNQSYYFFISDRFQGSH